MIIMHDTRQSMQHLLTSFVRSIITKHNALMKFSWCSMIHWTGIFCIRKLMAVQLNNKRTNKMYFICLLSMPIKKYKN